MLFLQVPAIPGSSFVWLPGLPALQAAPDHAPEETHYLTTRCGLKNHSAGHLLRGPRPLSPRILDDAGKQKRFP